MTDVVFTLPATDEDVREAEREREETERKEREKAERMRPVEPGDIFYSSWGYDQTNIDFFVVESVTKSRKSVRVHRIASKHVGSEGVMDLVVPDVSQRSQWRGESKTRRLSWSSFGPSFKVSSYAGAYRWNGEPKRETNPAFGH